VAYRPVARQRCENKQGDNNRCLVTAGKHVSNIRVIVRQPSITIELLGRCFLLGPPRDYIMRTPGEFSGMEGVRLWDIRRRRRTWARKAEEESPLLISVARNRLLKTLRAGKDKQLFLKWGISDGAVITCSSELCQWIQYPILTPSIVTPLNRDIMSLSAASHSKRSQSELSTMLHIVTAKQIVVTVTL
jgi:hypothetical protein